MIEIGEVSIADNTNQKIDYYSGTDGTGYNFPVKILLEQSSLTSSETMKKLQNIWFIIQKGMGILEVLMRFSESTGGYVQLVPEYAYFPILIGRDGKPVPLFKFLEVVDEIINYDEIQEALPNLSYSQISGALSFLKKVSEFNLRGIDIDDIENEIDADDVGLVHNLGDGLSDKEIARVLYQHQ